MKKYVLIFLFCSMVVGAFRQNFDRQWAAKLLISSQVPPSSPADVENFIITRSEVDWHSIALSWNTGKVHIVACTNRFYSQNDADWFILANSVDPPYVCTPTNYESMYYYIVSAASNEFGAYPTSHYDVGKFDVPLKLRDIPNSMDGYTYFSIPFIMFSNGPDHVLGRQWEHYVGTPKLIFYRNIGDALSDNIQWTSVGGVWKWNDDNVQFFTGAGNLLLFPLSADSGTEPQILTLVGKVPNYDVTNSITLSPDGIVVPQNWVGPATPELRNLNDNGWTNPLCNAESASSFDIASVNLDYQANSVDQYYNFWWDPEDPSTRKWENFAEGLDSWDPGKAGVIQMGEWHTNEYLVRTNLWICPYTKKRAP